MKNINVLYYSCPYDLSGYGFVSRNHLTRLNKFTDLSIRLRPRKFWRGPVPDLGMNKKLLESMEKKPIDNNNFIFIQHLTPENFFVDPRARYHVCYTPFETDGAPISWLLGLKAMDEIWVPSEVNKKAYARMKIDPNKIHVIPHGVDIDTYNPDVKPLDYKHGKFNFGSVFDWTERKNPVALIRAYFNAFNSGEDVSLTLRVFWRFPLEKTMEYVKHQIQIIKDSFNDRKDFPKIVLWTEILPDSVLPNLYKSFDCFVLPTRGEGFGLPFIESMACGVPAIGPAVGGNREFMDDSNSILVEGKMVPIDNGEFLRLQPQYAGQNWFDINEAQLSKAMRWVYDNPKDSKKITEKAVADLRDKWTWEHTAAKIYKRLHEIDSELNLKEVISKQDEDDKVEVV